MDAFDVKAAAESSRRRELSYLHAGDLVGVSKDVVGNILFGFGEPVLAPERVDDWHLRPSTHFNDVKFTFWDAAIANPHQVMGGKR